MHFTPNVFWLAPFTIWLTWMAVRYHRKIPNFGNQEEESRKLVREGLDIGIEESKIKVERYLNYNSLLLFKSLFFYILSYFMVVMIFFYTVKTGGEPSPLWQVMLAVFLIFLGLFMILVVQYLSMRGLRQEIMKRFTN